MELICYSVVSILPQWQATLVVVAVATTIAEWLLCYCGNYRSFIRSVA